MLEEAKAGTPWRWNIGQTRVRLDAGRSADDPEKAVLPCLIFIPAKHTAFNQNDFAGFGLALGWWDLGLKLTVLWPHT